MMDYVRKQPGISTVVVFLLGLFIGLVVLGWWLVPVEWTDAGPEHLAEVDQANYIRILASSYAADPASTNTATQILNRWPGADLAICQLRATSADPNEQLQLDRLAAAANGRGCVGVDISATPDAESGGNSLGVIVFLFILLLILVAAILFIINRRNAILMDDSQAQEFQDLPDSPPVLTDSGDGDVETRPLGRFPTTYTYGHDSYDDSFSIESETGDFLGECGVSISESIGTDLPKNVTAFEVWLFDKNDIRTVTKVVMSDHAFFDDALKAKLSPKGEQILAKVDETIVLETASLIVNAKIKEMAYGEGVLPPQSYFDRISFELSAWAKDGDFEGPDIQGRVDELLNY